MLYERIFDTPTMLIFGAITGLVFGFALQKGGVTRYSVILGQFLLKDFTVIKVMMTAVVVGAIGIYGMRLFNPELPMHIKNATLLGNAAGGIIFGIGMAILGYCPGTGVGALGDGSRHAIPGVLGMLVGAAVYAEVYPVMKDRVLGVVDLDKVTLGTVTGLSPWWFIVGLTIVAALGFYMLERWEHRGDVPAPAH